MKREWEIEWRRAAEWARTNFPEESREHWAAFANSVAMLVTGWSGGSGPSMREHLVSWSLGNRVDVGGITGIQLTHPRPGEWAFDAAVAFCAERCFGDADRWRDFLADILENEHCFDDDPRDLKALGS